MRRVPRPGAVTRRQWLGLAASMAWAPAQATLRDDERVLFLPGTARRLDAGRIEADLHAWVYEPERRPGLRTAFARYLGLDQDAMSAADRERFRRRCGLFLADSERGKEVVVRFEAMPAQPVRLPASDAAGRSRLRAVIDGAPRGGSAAHLDFHAVLADGDTRRFAGRALLVPPEGLSVVSDIDDTVKLTEVRDRHEMLLNTFARPSRAAPGMAARYRRLAAAPGTRVHYLSASPMQLLPVLEDFLAAAGFPRGSLHLRESTSWRSLVPGEGESRAHKLGAIAQLLHDFPARRFLFIGDSGEADPEIYAEVARAHPGRVQAILIRDVTGEGRDATRYRSAFEGIGPGRWHLLPPDGSTWPRLPA